MRKLISNNKIPKRQLKPVQFGKIGKKVGPDKILYHRKVFVNLSSNDYLGLSSNKNIVRESMKYARMYGNSSSSSRLITGNSFEFHEIEDYISKKVKHAKTLVMGNGFLLNSTVIPTITENTIGKRKKFSIFSDKLNHSSINYGSNLTNQRVYRYHHLDLNHLEFLLKKCKKNEDKLILSESLFSMDGDFVDLLNLRFLANKYNAILYIDEAHSFGIYGKNGFGISSEGLKSEREIMVGTFSKAVGSYGAFISCSRKFFEMIVQNCPGLIYSTALPPSVVGSIMAALKLFSKLNVQRSRLVNNSNFLIKKLKNLNLNLGNTSSHIIPIIFTNFEDCEKMRLKIFKKNFFVKSIRSPTVPVNKERIRISLTSLIKKNALSELLKVIEN